MTRNVADIKKVENGYIVRIYSDAINDKYLEYICREWADVVILLNQRAIR